MLDVISVGDATLDVFLTLNENDVDIHCRIDKPTCEICFNYADKIPVDSVDFSLGGNAANHAVAMSRLGFKAALYTVHGDDETGRNIDEKMRKEGLVTDHIMSEEGPSSYSTVINFKAERTILEKKYPRHYRLLTNFPVTPWMYVSSLGPDYESFFTEVSRFVRENKIKLGFNPAQLQLRSPFSTYESIVNASYVVFMNKEESSQVLTSAKLGLQDQRMPQVKVTGGKEWFTDSESWKNEEIKKALIELSRFGPKYSVITDGPKGAYAYDGGKFYFSSIFEAPVVERTGCGDAFASGFMAALMCGSDVKEAMRWGMFNSASVVGKIGPQEGILRKTEMENRLKENRDPVAVEI